MPDLCSRQLPTSWFRHWPVPVQPFQVVRDADGFLLRVTLTVLTGLGGLREFWILDQPVFQWARPCPILGTCATSTSTCASQEAAFKSTSVGFTRRVTRRGGGT